ncbi:DNA-directed RNA polymerase II subunit RPB2-like [Selaginella moellendorffii]|uniref:DNA-directed RNA polymerase II subunit RPB2-like n=1 Tax=Selaginella moellendorffii TaxID=88036 RepID=UPI000D1CB9C3|nr:DNA-directed RNA polymerase II subunit RPB2-like [Selaginella moellendorffii]|eukprot:XP_024544525.1 DNA-directed RNA polymerase II subunit RPB2-like [Selaginella moellendorffii]
MAEDALLSFLQQTEEISVEKEGSTASIKLLNASLRPLVVKYPWEARLGDQSYSARLFADIHVRLSNEKVDESFRNDEVFVGEIPCMIGSKLSNPHADGKIDCPLDPGAYFIVEGAEKVVVPQDSSFGARCSISRKGATLFIPTKACLSGAISREFFSRRTKESSTWSCLSREPIQSGSS